MRRTVVVIFLGLIAISGCGGTERSGKGPPVVAVWTPSALPADQVNLLLMADWGDNTPTCGDWGWYVSVEDYARVLVSLNAVDHKILTDCQLNDMETNPSNHPVGWDITTDGAGHRWLEKNGADSTNCAAQGKNCALQTTSVGIFGGRSGCGGTPPLGGVAGVLFINSDIANRSNVGADQILLRAFQDGTKPKP